MYSQSGQDKWVIETLNKPNGFFVDVGAYDGIESSNTYALEKLGWMGICIEANLDAYHRLTQNRTSINANVAVTDYNGLCRFGVDRINESGDAMMCMKLTDVLDQLSAPIEIDYLSIDVEGSEYSILSVFDFDKYKINLITVEHNLYLDGPYNKNRLFELLTGKGYKRVMEDVKCLDTNPAYFNQPYEDWYAK